MSNNNNHNNNNSPNVAGLDALAALYNSIGASTGQDMRHPGMAAQALASLASQSATVQGPAAAAGSTTSPSPYGLQSLYTQQLAAPQQQQVQQAQNQALLKSLPTELLQAYLASSAHQALPPSLTNNARQAAQLQQPQQQQNLNVQALAAQLLAAQSNPNQKHASESNDLASILQGGLMETLTRAGSSTAWGKASDAGILNQLQAAQKAAANPNTNPEDEHKVTPPAKLNSPPKKRIKSPALSTQAMPPVTAPAATKAAEGVDDKKLAKRAANRLSAHLSRKRKKMYIDDVTSENIELRRKVQILQSIPDLIVVFDSSGCISFTSHSVPNFFNMQGQELEGATFWDYLTEDSVNSIKSAFMDALAAKRNQDDDSTLLCHGESLLVKLLDKDGGEPTVVSFKGVVHFNDNTPECVSSMRPVVWSSTCGVFKQGPEAEVAANNSVSHHGKPNDVSDVESRKESSNSSSNDASDAESRKESSNSSSNDASDAETRRTSNESSSEVSE